MSVQGDSSRSYKAKENLSTQKCRNFLVPLWVLQPDTFMEPDTFMDQKQMLNSWWSWTPNSHQDLTFKQFAGNSLFLYNNLYWRNLMLLSQSSNKNMSLQVIIADISSVAMPEFTYIFHGLIIRALLVSCRFQLWKWRANCSKGTCTF